MMGGCKPPSARCVAPELALLLKLREPLRWDIAEFDERQVGPEGLLFGPQQAQLASCPTPAVLPGLLLGM